MIRFFALSLLLAAARQEPGDVEKRIAQLIERLDSEDLDARVAAETELLKVGAPALPALSKAASGSNKERAARAGKLGETIRFRVHGLIAYWGAYQRGGQRLCVVDPDGGEPREVLTGMSDSYCSDIRWVPGRRAIVVSVDIPQQERGGKGCFPDLWLVDLDAGKPKQITTIGATSEFAVSPDGRRIAYVVYGGRGGSNIAAIDVDGGSAAELTTDCWKVWEPAWSPDGKSILFRGSLEKAGAMVPGSVGMYLMAADGTGRKKICDELSGAAFTPDGASIVAQEYDWPQEPKKVLVFDIAKGSTRTIAENASWESAPSIAPDGKRVAFVRAKTGKIVVVGIDGKNESEVSPGSSVCWSTDGAWLAVEVDRSIRSIKLATSTVVELGKGSRPAWSH